MSGFGGLSFQIFGYRVFFTHLWKKIQGKSEDNVWP
jgi:hypothetical protein